VLNTSKMTHLITLCLLLLLPFSFTSVFAQLDKPITSYKQAHASKHSTKLEPVTLQLKWLHQFQFAGYYAAKIKGFYEQEGLDVTIKERDTLTNHIDSVLAGEAQYGVADSTLLLYQAKKKPLTIVAPIFQHSPQVFISLKSSGIDSLFDMENKSIAFYPKDSDGFPLLAMMHQNNIAVDLNRFSIKSGPEMLERGHIQVYPAYLSNEPYYFKQKGIEINVFHPMNYGIDLYGDLLFTHNDELKNYPNRVERFKRATIKGWHYALENKQEIIDYLIHHLKVDKTAEHLMYEAQVIQEAIQPNSFPIGTMDRGRLDFTYNLFVKHKLIDKGFDVSQGIYQQQQKTSSFTQAEVEWIKNHPTITVAIDNNWAPIDFVDKQGNHQGIAHDYLEFLYAFSGIHFIPDTSISWIEAVQKAKNQELDMYAAVTNTPERSEYMNFTETYLKFPMVIATRKGENFIDNIANLKNKIFAVGEGYAAQELLKKYYPELTLLPVSTPEKGLEAVSKGLAYGYVDNIAVVGHHIRSEGLSNIQISGELPFSADVAMAVRKDWPELVSIIQKALNSIDSKTQSSLNSKWLNVSYKKEFDWQKIILIITPLLLITLIILIYTRKLKKLNCQLSNSNLELQETQKTLAITNTKLEQAALTDSLTGLSNRKHLDNVLNAEINRSDRYGNPFSLIMLDLDHFKQVNDTFGHLTGDEVLKAVSQTVQSTIRETDTIGRWGGEEFMIICPATNGLHASIMSNKILSLVKKITFQDGLVQTVSIGLATHMNGESAEKLVERADRYLYKAKERGRDQVATDDTP